jgi:hypothetical protein
MFRKMKEFYQGIGRMAEHINERDGEARRMFTASSMLLTVNYHAMQLERDWRKQKRIRDFNRCNYQFTKRCDSTSHNDTCPDHRTD